MAFLSFPFMFEDDDDDDNDLGLPKEKKLVDTVINTNCIVSYTDYGGKTRVKMINGCNYDMPISIDEFEDILMEVDNIIDIKPPCMN